MSSTLRLRIGLSTGDAFVGDYGGSAKLDYTCIGDTVNVASRLEGANKSFGTSILVNQATRDLAGDRFAFRAMGRFRVPGRKASLSVFELVGDTSESSPEEKTFIDLFGQAVGAYQRCEWGSSAKLFEQCRSCRSDDPLVTRYAQESANRLAGSPPPFADDPSALPTL
jgi:hypothetical protein